MKPILPLLLLICFTAAAHADIPLAEAAATFTDKLPAGCLVTAERIDGTDRFAIAGKAEPAGILPEHRIFEIGSISKVFTGILLADAVHAKKVRFDSTLKDLLGARQNYADPKIAQITLLQLATHTSGLPRLPDNMGSNPDGMEDPYSKYDRKLLHAFLATAKLPGEPPYPADYSNLGMGLLGDILAEVHGKSWEDLVTGKIARPLGMKDTVVVLDRKQKERLAPPYSGKEPAHSWTFEAMAGAGALRSTAADMLLFGQALIEPEKTPLAAVLKDTLEVRAPFGAAGTEIGLAILIGKVDGERTYEHSGGTGGYRSNLQVIPGRKTVRVVLINNDPIPAEAVTAATRVKAEKPADGAPARKLSEAELDAFTGVYEMGKNTLFTVLRRDAQLIVRLTGQPFLPIVPAGQADRFRYTGVEAELQFTRKDTKVESLTLFQNGREIPAPRIDRPLPVLSFPTEAELKPFLGEYELAPGKIVTVLTQGGTLFAQLTGQPPAAVFQTKPGYFEYDIVEASLEFQREKDGPVTGLILHQNGDHPAKKR